MVAEDHTVSGKVEDGHAGTDASMGTIPVAGERWICLGGFGVLFVQCGVAGHCFRCRFRAVEERFHLGS